MTNHDAQVRISQLFIHPVKSCAGISVAQAQLLSTGLEWDRHWMVVDDLFEAGDFVTQRTLPKMALIQPQFRDNALVLNAPSMPELVIPIHTGTGTTIGGKVRKILVRVWSDHIQTADEGDVAAQWLGRFLNRDLRLVRFIAGQERRSSSRWTGDHKAYTEFGDGFALLIASQESLDELNEKLTHRGHDPVGMERFRANIVLQGVQPQDEDLFDILRIAGNAVDGVTGKSNHHPILLKGVKPCTRCVIPNIDPVTAQSAPDVGLTLAAYRSNAIVDGATTFGMNYIVLQGAGALLRVGQVITGDFRFT